MTKNEILDTILAIADVYGKELSPSRAKLYVEAVHEYIQGIDQGHVYKTVTRSCEYFPTPKQLIDLFHKPSDHHQDAIEFVDRMIIAFTNSGIEGREYAGLGKAGYNIAKNVLGVDRWAFTSGRVKPEYNRKAWIEAVECYLSGGHEKPLELESNNPTLELVQPKTID